MKVYVSKRDENVTAKIIKENEKFKTVVILYLTGDKAGQNNSITTSTLKRWWKEVEVDDIIPKVIEEEKSKESSIDVSVIAPKDAKTGEPELELPSNFSVTNIDSVFDVSITKSNSSYYRVKYNGNCIAELFVRKSFIYVCTKRRVEGFEVVTKAYRPYPEYHKVTSAKSVNKILMEVK